MVILTLIDPEQQTPLKQWYFENEALICIGRSPDNQVVLDNNEISRYHLELCRVRATEWQLVNKGINGTFINGERVEQSLLSDGTQFQLAKSGPVVKFQSRSTAAIPGPTTGQSQPRSKVALAASVNQSTANEEAALQAKLVRADEERSQLQSQLQQLTQEKTQLQAILNAINEQFPPTSLQQQQTALTARLAEVQRLQAEMTQMRSLLQRSEQPEIVLTKSEQERLLGALSSVVNDLEKQQLQLNQSQQQLVKAMQVLSQLEAHQKRE